MNLTDQQTQDFVDAWQKDFGETLSRETAEAEASRLLDFFAEMAETLGSPGDKGEEIEECSGLKAPWKRVMRRG